MDRGSEPARRWPGIEAVTRSLTIIAGIALLAGCSPLALDRTFQGQLLDADTGRPVVGAAIDIERYLTCFQVLHSRTHNLPRREARTDATGRFEISTGFDVAGCWGMGWSEYLRVLAPGYSEIVLKDAEIDPHLVPGPLTLERWRYASESEWRRQGRLAREEEARPLRRSALEAIRAASVEPLGPLGVFAAAEDARFDQVAIAQVEPTPPWEVHWQRAYAIVARDRATGRIHTFSMQGAPIDLALPATEHDLGVLATSAYLPLLVGGDRLYWLASVEPQRARDRIGPGSWDSIPAHLGNVSAGVAGALSLVTVEGARDHVGIYHVRRPADETAGPRGGSRRLEIHPDSLAAVADFLPGARPPISCLAQGGGGGDHFLFVTETERGTGLFSAVWFYPVEGADRGKRTLATRRLETPSGLFSRRVTACAGGDRALYVAFEDGRLSKLVPRAAGEAGLDPRWRDPSRRLDSRDGSPVRFVSLVVARIGFKPDVLYGVALNGSIYRFSHEGTPDQRIELRGPGILTDH